MALRVSGKNLAIGEALRGHVHERIEAIVGKYKAGVPTGHVTIEPEGSGYRADCTLFLKAGITLQVEALAHDPYASFDKAAERIERRLGDHRKRMNGHHGDSKGAGLSAEEAEAIALPPLDVLEPDEDEPSETFAAIIAENAAMFEEMTVPAAVAAMDASGRQVVVFRFAENKRINIVYRRPDGNIGWLDPLGTSGRA